VEAVIDTHLAYAVFVGQFHAALHRVKSNRLAKLVLGIPDLGCLEP
jgi:hypothetical protein